MKDILFSVIIPVYKVEQYLRECVDSVLNQTFKNFEIILVDDGSPDTCPQICDDYAEKDVRIKVIHKSNGGLSSARNAGIQIAAGEYLMFLDSDDYWNENDALLKLSDKLISKEYDIVQYNCYLGYPDGRLIVDRADRIFPRDMDSLTSENQMKVLIENDIFPGSAWIFAIRRELVQKNGLLFKEGIRSEDTEWMFRVMDCKPIFAITDLRFYVYRKERGGSITNSIGSKHLYEYFNIIADYCDNHTSNDNLQTIINSYVAYHYVILCGLVTNMTDEHEKKTLLEKVKKYRHLLKYQLNPKVRKIAVLNTCLGFNLTMFALKVYMRNR